MRCKTIEHTADIGIEVEADSLEELFQGAALGMMSLIVDPSSVTAAEQRTVSLTAGELGELMFEWLNELLFMVDGEGMLLSEVTVRRVEPTALEAEVGGEPLDPERHRLRDEIKAATYHQMTVEPRGDGWFARIVFDV